MFQAFFTVATVLCAIVSFVIIKIYYGYERAGAGSILGVISALSILLGSWTYYKRLPPTREQFMVLIYDLEKVPYEWRGQILETGQVDTYAEADAGIKRIRVVMEAVRLGISAPVTKVSNDQIRDLIDESYRSRIHELTSKSQHSQQL